MKNFMTACLAAISISTPSLAQGSSALAGTWRQDDGKIVVRIGNCPSGRDLCATVIEEKPNLSEPRRLGKIVVREIKAVGSARWTGQFIDQNVTMNGTIRQSAPDTMSFKICSMGFLCETKRFDRVRP
jgi:uncharacterized protein (DUF2147 family)